MADYQVRGSYKMPQTPIAFKYLTEYTLDPSSELDLQYRGDSINVYYKGGSLLKISGKKSLNFDKFYFYIPSPKDMRSSDIKKLCKDDYEKRLNDKPSKFVKTNHLQGNTLLEYEYHEKAKQIYAELQRSQKDICTRLLKSKDKDTTISIIEEMKNQMDKWKNNLVHNGWRMEQKDERSVQQYISLYNKQFGLDVDYIVLDIEYALSKEAKYKMEGRSNRKQPRLDVLAVDRSGQLYVYELKYGMKSVDLQKASAKDHKEDFEHSVGNDTKWLSFIADINKLFETKKKDGLIEQNVYIDTNRRPIFAFIMKCEVPTDRQDFNDHLTANGMAGIKTLFLDIDSKDEEYLRHKYLLSDR